MAGLLLRLWATIHELGIDGDVFGEKRACHIWMYSNVHDHWLLPCNTATSRQYQEVWYYIGI